MGYLKSILASVKGNSISKRPKLVIFPLALVVIAICMTMINSQIKDFTFDTHDDYITEKEHFNIYYKEIKERELNQNKGLGIWASEQYDLDQYRKNLEKENLYLKQINQNNDNGAKDGQYDSSLQELLQIRKKYNSDNVDFDEDDEYYQNSIPLIPEDIRLNDRAKLHHGADLEFNPGFHDQSRRKGGRITQGHPGMNMDSIISHRQFTGVKDSHRFNNFNTNTQSTFSYFSMVNFSIFGYSLSEYLFVSMILIFGYFYIFSKTFNDKYATSWFDANKIYFDKFAKVSMKPEVETLKNNTPMVKDAFNIYRYYVEDFKSIKWLTVILEFKNKQDSTSFISGIFFTIKDKVYYRVAINPVDPVPNVFCICKKTEHEVIKRSYKDIEFFTSFYQPSNFEDYLVEMAENEFTGEMFRNKELLHYFKQVENFIDIIYYTDQKIFAQEEFALYFVFTLPLNEINQSVSRKYLEITHFVCLFSEELSQIKFNDIQRSNSKSQRVKFERMKLDDAERKRLEQLDLDEEIRKEKERAKLKFSKGRKVVKEHKTN